MTPAASVYTDDDLPNRLAVAPTEVAQRILRQPQPLPDDVAEALRRLYAGEGGQGDARTMICWGLSLLADDDARVRELRDELSAMAPADREAWLDYAGQAWAPLFAKMGRVLGRLPDVAAVADDVRLRGCVVEPGCALDLDSNEEAIVAHDVVQAPTERMLAAFTLPGAAVPPPRNDHAAIEARVERLADAVLREVE